MATENVVFERFVSGRTPNDKILLRLTSENPTPLSNVMPIEMNIGEGFGVLSPVVSMTFIDGSGVLFNKQKLDYSNIFYLSIGKDLINQSTTIPLRISTVNVSNTTGNLGKSDQVSYKVSMVYANWGALFNTRHSRSWSTDYLFSEIVSEIIEECGVTTTDIQSSTQINKRATIQPYWTNAEMIRDICSRDLGRYDDAFQFALTLKGKFIYRQVSDIIEKTNTSRVPFLTLQNQPLSAPENDDDAWGGNYGVPNYFAAFEGSERYMSGTTSGGGGVNGMFYDFEDDSFVSLTGTVDQFNLKQLTDYTTLNSEHNNTQFPVYGSDQRDMVSKVINRVSDIMLSYNTFTIMTEGNYNISTADVVGVIIPTPLGIFDDPISEMYSGLYVVSSVTHNFKFANQNTYTTRIGLSRHGFDGKQQTGYVKSKLGKDEDL